MPASGRNDPYKNCNFLVEFEGAVTAGFSECTRLSSEVEIIEYREGGDFRVRKFSRSSATSRLNAALQSLWIFTTGIVMF